MKKTVGEINQIFADLKVAYEKVFGEATDVAVIESVLNEYLAKCKKDFVLSRIYGLDALGTKVMLDLCRPSPPVLEKGENVGKSRSNQKK